MTQTEKRKTADAIVIVDRFFNCDHPKGACSVREQTKISELLNLEAGNASLAGHVEKRNQQ